MTRVSLFVGLAAIAATALAGCGAPSDMSTGVDAAPPGVSILFDREGLPGPWWRPGATHEMFDAEHRVCLVRSKEARTDAEDPADAAYRSFLACMLQAQWVRGLPPKPQSSEAARG